MTWFKTRWRILEQHNPFAPDTPYFRIERTDLFGSWIPMGCCSTLENAKLYVDYRKNGGKVVMEDQP